MDNSTIENKTILVLAPHPDDGELGCGGTLKKLSENNNQIFYAVFSPCLKSLPEGCSQNQLYDELDKATQLLGIDKNNIIKYDIPVREFPSHRQKILEALIKLKQTVTPDIVFIPNSFDMHQDHKTIHDEGVRAFKHSLVLGYELPWNNREMRVNTFFKLERGHINAKKMALHNYSSQRFRPYFNDEFFYGLAKVRGIQCNSDYAEGFEWISGTF